MDLAIEDIRGLHETKANTLLPGLSVLPVPSEIGETGFLSRFRLEVNRSGSVSNDLAAAPVRTDRDPPLRQGVNEAAELFQSLAGAFRFLTGSDGPSQRSPNESLGIDPVVAKVGNRIDVITERLDAVLDRVRAYGHGGRGMDVEKQAARLADLPTRDLGIGFSLSEQGLKVRVDREQLSKSLWAHSDAAKKVLSTAARELETMADVTRQQNQAEQQKQLYAGAVQVSRVMARA